ncbi:MAG: hypothetical protein M1819_002800 [Sarea resinae]|nr:MAG: hypothetical protein M1819_002800 [Sarea resinae]
MKRYLRGANALQAHDPYLLGSVIPPFLCPALISHRPAAQNYSQPRPAVKRRPFSQQSCKLNITATPTAAPDDTKHQSSSILATLPVSCPGCGALTQTIDPGEAGFYSPKRKSVKSFVPQTRPDKSLRKHAEDDIYEKALENAGEGALKELGLVEAMTAAEDERSSTTPVCDRCNNLLNHRAGVSIDHPTMQSIEETVAESPYKYNHIYHVLDAADFPLSLVPGLHKRLSLAPLRSKNRRAKSGKFYAGRKSEVSFIITRSDLLAPKKEQVDSLMPYLVQVLRDALGSSGEDVRLGNVRCVSSKRGWWTKKMKEDIWNRGGGGWLVGKVNVGKSNLFETVYPKGRSDDISFGKLRNEAQRGVRSVTDDRADDVQMGEYARETFDQQGRLISSWNADGVDESLEKDSLLPPAQPETDFPVMPIISALPGTTASPIRLPFGGGKGELIDLPGLARGDLDTYVQDDHRLDLVMRHRPKPTQQVIKPGQSLLLGGGLVRITPKTPDLVILAYAFVPLEVHLTSTEKAVGIQSQQRQSGVSSIVKPGVGEKMASAGTFRLKWDVTKQRSGPLTAPAAAALKVDQLPYRVLATDLLIEGCGWVELVAQVRKKALEFTSQDKITSSAESPPSIPNQPVDENPTPTVTGQADSDVPSASAFPEIEVFTPSGKHVGARRPMSAWVLGGAKSASVSGKKKARPRPSMKGKKKIEKKMKRVAA